MGFRSGFGLWVFSFRLVSGFELDRRGGFSVLGLFTAINDQKNNLHFEFLGLFDLKNDKIIQRSGNLQRVISTIL